MDKAEKQEQIDFLTDRFGKAQLALCADYRGLTVAQITKLRGDLRKAGATARVVKNKLAKRASSAAYKSAEGAEVEKFLGLFKEPSFVVFSDVDPVAPTKVLVDFAKANEKLQVKGAWVDRKFVSVSGVTDLSKMPGKQELLAKLLSLLNAPATQLVGLLQAPAAQMVRLVEAQRLQLEGKGS